MISNGGAYAAGPYRGQYLRSETTRVGMLSRLYIWSVVLEPLLLFVLSDATGTGVTGSVSKLLQGLVALLILLKLTTAYLNGGLDRVRLINFSHPLFSGFRNYFALVVVAGLVGAMRGAYQVPFAYVEYVEFSAFAKVLNSSAVRPVVEYLILAYYFVYFVVLPKYLLNSRPKLEHFLSVFKAMFIASFVLGLADLALSGTTGAGFIPRHLGEEWRSVGVRYHGLAGEPREAFVYLFLGLGILHLEAWYRGRKLNGFWIWAIVFAAIATQSASGLIGLLLFSGFYFAYSVTRMTPRKILLLLGVVLAISAAVYIAVVSSERILAYLEAAQGIWGILESERKIPHLMAVQMVNIYPIYDLWVKLQEHDFLPILIGSGLGSASAINNFIPGSEFAGLANPHSQFIRVVYESGIIGLYLFVTMFTRPIASLTRRLSSAGRNEFMLVTLLVLGCSMGHRSSACFIYLGLAIAVFQVGELRGSLGCRQPASAN